MINLDFDKNKQLQNCFYSDVWKAIFKALTNNDRLSPKEIAEYIGSTVSHATVRGYLKRGLNYTLFKKERLGKKVEYEIATPSLKKYIKEKVA